MKGEYFGCRKEKNSLLIFNADRLPDELFSRIERFRFPANEFPSEEQRLNEIEVDRSYHHRSTYLIYLSPVDHFTIVAITRLIAKRNHREKLPIEYGCVAAITDSSPENPVIMKVGESLRIAPKPEVLPACEIGGLRAADPNRELGITIRMRYTALDSIMKQCGREVESRGIRTVYLTCLARFTMQHIYRDRYLFNEAGEVTYGTDDRWKALWRKMY